MNSIEEIFYFNDYIPIFPLQRLTINMQIGQQGKQKMKEMLLFKIELE